MWYLVGSVVSLASLLIGLFLGVKLQKNKKSGGISPRPPGELIDEIVEAVKDDIEAKDTIDKLKERLGI